MAHYRVTHASSHHLTLKDDVGRHHAARALHDSLPVRAELYGPRPVPGFALLSNASTLNVYRVIFEEVDFSPIGDLVVGQNLLHRSLVLDQEGATIERGP